MSEQGGIIETLGFEVKLEGTFENVEVVDGKLQLKKKTQNPITYHNQGTWTSDVIDIGDEFESYTKIIATIINDGNSSAGFSTRTSGDGLTFEDWRGVGTDNAILSTKKRYIQVKADMYVGMTDETVEIGTVGFANEFVESAVYRAGGSQIPALTSNTPTVTGFPFAESSYSSSFEAWKAFDKTNAHYTTASNKVTGFLGYKFTTPKVIDSYELMSTNVSTQAPVPRDWTFEASNDTTDGSDGTWDILDTQTGFSWTQLQKRMFRMSNKKPHVAYRIRWTTNNGNGSTSIGELDMFSPELNNIQLKREYNYDMSVDESWTETGSLHRKSVTRSEWLKIDRLDVK